MRRESPWVIDKLTAGLEGWLGMEANDVSLEGIAPVDAV